MKKSAPPNMNKINLLKSLLPINHPSRMKFPIKEKESDGSPESAKKSIIKLVLERIIKKE